MVVSATLDSPCRGCTDRCVRCHSSCGRYAEYRQELDRRKQERHAIQEQYDLTMVLKRELIRRVDNQILGRKYR